MTITSRGQTAVLLHCNIEILPGKNRFPAEKSPTLTLKGYKKSLRKVLTRRQQSGFIKGSKR
jgi:hypothetical protein